MKTINKKGYVIVKSTLTANELSLIKTNLTVTPFVNTEYSDIPHSFKVYKESKNNIYLPRFYGLDKFGEPNKIKFKNYPENSNLDFPYTLRDNQKPAVNACLDALKSKGGAILSVKCGGGKCLGKDTPVLMYNGGIKKVQDIIVGDALMGDDSTPRIVSTVCTGKEKMYLVKQENGDDYRVNESHILSLYNEITKEVEDISVKDYLADIEKQKNLFGYKVNADYKTKNTLIRAYILGYWLGLNDDSKIYDKSFNHFLKKMNLTDDKYIPDDYKYNSKKKKN